jgi:dTDP-4-amino-4,6-dideoxygalactose transaminase
MKIWHSSPVRLDGSELQSFLAHVTRLNAEGGYRSPNRLAAQVRSELDRFYELADDEVQTFTTRSGFDALTFALRVVGVREGSGVVVPSFAYHAVGLAVASLGATAIWSDVCPTDWNMGVKEIEEAVAASDMPVSAICAVDNFGTPVDLIGISAWAREFGIPLVLDACESLGSSRAPCWELADAIAMSFSFSKPIHAAGMGGAVTIRESWARNLQPLDRALLGQVALPELNAAYLLACWPRLPSIVNHLRTVYSMYSGALAEVGWSSQTAPAGDSSRVHAPFLVPDDLGSTFRDFVISELGLRSVEARVQFPRQDLMLGFEAALTLNVSDDLVSRVISLPTGGGLSTSDAARVAGELRRICLNYCQ